MAGSLNSFAQGLSDQTLECTLAKPLEIGAAITARFPEMFPGSSYNIAMRMMIDEKGQQVSKIGGRRIKGSPSSNFLQHYGRGSFLSRWLFASTGINTASWFGRDVEKDSVESKVRDRLGWNNMSDGADQIAELLDGRNRPNFDRASIIFAVDLMYWDAMHEGCETNEYPEFMARRLIHASATAGKPLFIGTVPKEDAAKVPINSLTSGVEGVWYPIRHECAQKINDVIRENCVTSNACYIVDLEAMAAELNADKQLFVKKQNRGFNRRQMRPDGVHISEVGAQYVFEKMQEAFEANPPQNTCRK